MFNFLIDNRPQRNFSEFRAWSRMLLCAGSLVIPTGAAIAQNNVFNITPEQSAYTAPENGSYILVNYNFTNTGNYPIYIWSTPASSPEVFSIQGDPTDSAYFLGEVSYIQFPVNYELADPGQTVYLVQYVFQTPNEDDGTDFGITVYSVFPILWLTVAPDVNSPFIPDLGTASGFAIQVNDVPETSTWMMMLAGFAGLAATARLRAKNSPFGV